MKTFAFVFARGGSKGLPGKNIKSLCGKPLIQYSIQIAQQVASISEVFVSTDDDEIAQISSSLGAIVIQRPSHLATDNSKEWLSWQHGVEWVEQRYGKFDTFVSLPATSPLRSVEDVEACITQLHAAQADICISITEANRSPYFNMVKQNKDGFVELVNSSSNPVFRRQDAPEVYDITTVVYATTPQFVLEYQSLFDGKVTSIVVPKERAIDIDDIYDFRLAEVILKEHQHA